MQLLECTFTSSSSRKTLHLWQYVRRMRTNKEGKCFIEDIWTISDKINHTVVNRRVKRLITVHLGHVCC